MSIPEYARANFNTLLRAANRGDLVLLEWNGTYEDIEINTYATDGWCHNAEPRTFNRECGKPATFIGIQADSFASSFCDVCKD
jgi:hypothetical protein